MYKDKNGEIIVLFAHFTTTLTDFEKNFENTKLGKSNIKRYYERT